MARHINDKRLGSCPSCQGLEAKTLFSAQTPHSEFHLIQCKTCELTRTFRLPTAESLPDLRSYYGRDADKFNPIIQKIRNLVSRIRVKTYLRLVPDWVQTPKILDVGCAEGRLLSAFLEHGCQCWGVEHPSYPAHRFMNVERIQYLQGDLRTIDLPEEAFDMVFLWHVLEHVDDPKAIMSRLYELLSPEGTIIVAVPNFSSMESQRFRRFWFHLDIPWHKYHFNERSLRYLVSMTNYKIVHMTTRCFEQGPYGLFQSILNAMGWRQNEFYEGLKGNLTCGRFIPLIVQFFIGLFLLIPVSYSSALTSNRGGGPVIKLILRKGRG